LVTRSQGTKVASDSLKGRVLGVSLADLNQNEDHSYRTIRLKIEDVQGKNCLTNFYGMDFTTDKLKMYVKKWQSLIEAHVDIKTVDGYALRIFCIGFTKKVSNIKKTCYAKSSQIKRIRRKMVDIITRESNVDLKALVDKFVADSIGDQITRACESIYPLSNVFLRKVKIVKAPKFDPYKLMELHGEAVTGSQDTGAKVERAEPEATK